MRREPNVHRQRDQQSARRLHTSNRPLLTASESDWPSAASVLPGRTTTTEHVRVAAHMRAPSSRRGAAEPSTTRRLPPEAVARDSKDDLPARAPSPYAAAASRAELGLALERWRSPWAIIPPAPASGKMPGPLKRVERRQGSPKLVPPADGARSSGTSTKIPQSPYTTLGIAANSSRVLHHELPRRPTKP